MDWNRIEGNWKQFKGSAKEKWGKLTDDDLQLIEGRREQLEGRLQERLRQGQGPGPSGCRRLAEVAALKQHERSPGESRGF
ncbi:uncharacterized protein YjbJ (UPF0337 family) [Bradyrhizobium yuanmingense]